MSLKRTKEEERELLAEISEVYEDIFFTTGHLWWSGKPDKKEILARMENFIAECENKRAERICSGRIEVSAIYENDDTDREIIGYDFSYTVGSYFKEYDEYD